MPPIPPSDNSSHADYLLQLIIILLCIILIAALYLIATKQGYSEVGPSLPLMLHQ